MRNEKVFIIIVTYNAEAWLPLCCKESASLPPGWEILAVDNGSTDGTVRALQERYPEVRLLENKSNLGFGRANNIALRTALLEEADYVFLLNQDAEIPLSGIQALIDLHKRCPECLVLSPVHLSGSGDELDHGFARACLPPEAAPGLVFDALSGKLQDVYYSRKGVAAAWLLSREALVTIGGFNPLFYHYGEDEDYVNRVHFHGYRVGVAARVFASHHREQRPRRKAVDSRFIDALIRMTDPARPAPMRMAVSLRYLPMIFKQLLRGRFSLAVYFFSCWRNLLKGGRLSCREMGTHKGPSFL